MVEKNYTETLTEEDLAKFDWLTLRKDMDTHAPTETRKDKLIRKITENPLVPIGCLATTTALFVGLWSFKSGKRQLSQYMMRTRVLAQGFTVFALVIGLATGASSVTGEKKTGPDY